MVLANFEIPSLPYPSKARSPLTEIDPKAGCKQKNAQVFRDPGDTRSSTLKEALFPEVPSKVNHLQRRCSLPFVSSTKIHDGSVHHSDGLHDSDKASAFGSQEAANSRAARSTETEGDSTRASRKRSRNSLGNSSAGLLSKPAQYEENPQFSCRLATGSKGSSPQKVTLPPIGEATDTYKSDEPFQVQQTPYDLSENENQELRGALVNPMHVLPDFDQVQQIRQAVRALTLLSPECRSSESEPAQSIYALTGYTIGCPSYTPRRSSVSADMSRAGKAEVFHLLGGEQMLSLLDACKVRDATIALDATQCRVEKDRRFGRYNYVHLPSDSCVTAEAYEHRYISMLNEVCAWKWGYWKDYFDRLKALDHEFHCNGKATTTLSTDPARDSRILPLPSRDGVSDDPEIAAAEQELWEKIDLALEEYSQKVLEIEQRKRELT